MEGNECARDEKTWDETQLSDSKATKEKDEMHELNVIWWMKIKYFVEKLSIYKHEEGWRDRKHCGFYF